MTMNNLGLRAPRGAAGWLLALLLVVGCAIGPQWSHAAAAEKAAVNPQEEMQAGMRSFRLGDFTLALQHWSAAASAYEASGDVEEQARALLRVAEAELNLGRGPNALNTLHKAQGLAERSGNAKLRLAVESGLGNAYVLTGRDADAERALRRRSRTRARSAMPIPRRKRSTTSAICSPCKAGITMELAATARQSWRRTRRAQRPERSGRRPTSHAR